MIPERLPWHRPQWQRVERGVREGRVPHALLLRGAAGNGKARFAARLAAALLCRSDSPPCRACESCRLCAAGSHPDRFEVTIPEDRREIVVDQIRDLVHSVSLTARLGGYKAVIVNPAEQMNRHAANTLLKTLEEPPGATVFILVSSNHALLLATIRSRCQMVDFPVADREIALKWLRDQLLERRATGHETDETHRRRPGRQEKTRRRSAIDTSSAGDRAGDRYPPRDVESSRENDASPDPAEALDLARGAPMRALELLCGGSLELRRNLDRDLDELLAGGDPMTVAARWKEIGRATVSLWLTDILADRLRANVVGRADSAGPGPASVHFVRLLPMLERSLELRGEVQARSNANEQLALERLALAIAAKSPVAGRRHQPSGATHD